MAADKSGVSQSRFYQRLIAIADDRLVAADKSGVSQSRFYQRLIAIADDRYGDHLTTLAEKIASLSPEHRELVERQAEELIAQERARRARSLTKRPAPLGNGRPVRRIVKPCYFRKAAGVGVVRRQVRQFRRGSLTRTRGVGHRRRLGMVR